MSKLISLTKACALDNMTLFKLSPKQQSSKIEKVLPYLFTLMCLAINWCLAEAIIKELIPFKQEIIMLTLFVIYTSAMTIIEGIYKSSGLLFNCKDDDLLFSLPIKKSTILFIRVFKFYIFEVLYNSLFLVPAIIVYAIHMDVNIYYYISSILALLILPIIPIIISSIIGGSIALISTRFKFKTFVEIIVTGGSLLAIFLIAMNFDQETSNVVQKGINIHEMAITFYYPAKQYINLVLNYTNTDLISFIVINLTALILPIILLNKPYCKINSKMKINKKSSKSRVYKIKVRSKVISLIKKELKRFISSPIYVTNSSFGLALFIISCIFLSIKYNSLVQVITENENMFTAEQIKELMPLVFIGFICFTALMTSITSSMISLEGKAFNILKSMPVKPHKIVYSKVLASLVIILPFLIIGDLIVLYTFKFTMYEMIMIIANSLVMPVVAESIGIIVNLKYPRMDAENDTQVVKQSMSSMISVLIGMIMITLTIGLLYLLVVNQIQYNTILLIVTLAYLLLAMVLLLYIRKNSEKEFFNIN